MFLRSVARRSLFAYFIAMIIVYFGEFGGCFYHGDLDEWPTLILS